MIAYDAVLKLIETNHYQDENGEEVTDQGEETPDEE